MIIKDKNKLKSKAKSKILVLGFILLIVGVGFFGGAGKAGAQAPADPMGTCNVRGTDGTITPNRRVQSRCPVSPPAVTFTPDGTPPPPADPDPEGFCTLPNGTTQPGVRKSNCPTPPNTWAAAAPTAAPTPPVSDFEKYISQNGCGLGIGSNTSLLPGCLISGSYYLFYAIPSGILWLAAYFFNILISVTLSSKLLLAPFVASAWAVVRDLSNIFFILILLYVAIELILGLGHDAKKMIVKVVIIALLINFSMFFTKVVIDSSNILALVFYNKLDVCTNKDATGKCRHYDTVTGEKDVSGSMMDAFDPTRLLTGDFFKTARTINVPGVGPTSIPISYQMIILVTILAGLVMLFAAYAFFIAGLSFMGRMIELFVLIVFSPFALMSSTIPILEKTEYIGWDAWLKRLLTVSFMAPIFMFFMYFIFMLVSVKPGIFSSLVTQTGDSMLVRIMSVIIPAGLLLILLLKATDFAKKGSGKFGEVMMTGAKLVGGLALGATALGTAVIGRKTMGAVAKQVQGSDATRQKAYTFKDTRDKWNKMNKVNPFAYLGLAGTAIAGGGKAISAGVAAGIHAIPGTGGKTIGQHIQAQDVASGKKQTATHILDTKAGEYSEKNGGSKDTKYKDLTEAQQKDVKEEVDKDTIAKVAFGKAFSSLDARTSQLVTDAIRTIRPNTDGTIDFDVVPDPTRPTVKDTYTAKEGGVKKEELAKTKPAIGQFVQALRKGSYDIRNITEAKMSSQQGFNKALMFPLIGIALAIKSGLLKTGAGVDVGIGKKDFLEDLKGTLIGALSNIKINVGNLSGGAKNPSGGGGHH